MSEKEAQDQQDEITEETAQDIFKELESSLLSEKTASENTDEDFDLIESWGEGIGKDRG